MSYATATINTQALTHNLSIVRQHAPKAQVLAMVKADAYGHGLLPMVETLVTAGVDAIGIARLEEGKELIEQGIETRIVLMDGVLDSEELKRANEYQLEVVLHRAEQLDQLHQISFTHPLSVWLKINTGMNRLGIAPQQIPSCWQALQQIAHIKQPMILMSHLAKADELNSVENQQQIQCFFDSTSHINTPKSLANSAAILAWPETHADWVRPGIMLYGASPFADQLGTAYGLQPVMTLQSRIIAIQSVRQGDAVGYGGSWICPEDMPLGVVAMGYGDGYPRHIKENTPVLVNGQRANIVGRVSMDMITIDLRSLPNAKVGDTVTFWGDGLPIEIIAKQASTIPYELLCQVTPRVKKIVQNL